MVISVWEGDGEDFWEGFKNTGILHLQLRSEYEGILFIIL